MLFTFLLIFQTVIAALLVGVILMQRSEGGGLGVSSSGGGGLMSARGASDFLTRATAILATFFVALSIILAGLAASSGTPAKIDTSLAKEAAPLAPGAPPVGQAPAGTPIVPFAGDTPGTAPAPVTTVPAPVPTGNSQGVPLAK